MTREEAIIILKDCELNPCVPKDKEAANMAIEALEQEPCEDAISRRAAIDLIADYDLSMGEVVKGIHNLPSITPQPKAGKWIYTGDYITDGMLKCSECGFEHDVSERFVYCPNCGKRMEAEE